MCASKTQFVPYLINSDRSDSESADSGLPGQSQYFDNRLLEVSF